jgi:hypothetical protein
VSIRYGRGFGLVDASTGEEVDGDAVRAADEAAQDEATRRTSAQMRERAVQVGKAAAAVSVAFPAAAPAMIALVALVAAGLAICEGALRAADAIGLYGDQNSEEDFAAMSAALASFLQLGLPAPVFDSELSHTLESYRAIVQKLHGKIATRPPALAAGVLFLKHGMDPVLQDSIDRTRGGRGWFLPFRMNTVSLASSWANNSVSQSIARALHLEYGAPEESIRNVATNAYAAHFVARLSDYDSDQMGHAIGAFVVAWEAAEVWARANRRKITIGLLSPLTVQTFAPLLGINMSSATFSQDVLAETKAQFVAEQQAIAAEQGTAPPVVEVPGVSAPVAVASVAAATGIGWLVFTTAGKAVLRRYTGINL